jgi:chromosome partitioning protein
MARATLHKDVPGLGSQNSHVVIDGPPRVNDLARSAIMASDLVIIPVQPSPYDIWAADEIVKLIQEAMIYKSDLKARFVVNRLVSNTAIGREVADALKDYPFEVFKTAITQRVVFAESAAAGLSVLEFAPKGPAALEVLSLVSEIEAALV